MTLGDVIVLTTGVGQNATNVYLVGLVKIVINVQLDGLVKIVINVTQAMMDTHIARVSNQNKLFQQVDKKICRYFQEYELIKSYQHPLHITNYICIFFQYLTPLLTLL